MTWIPRFAGDVIARYRRGADGKTPRDRETGRKCNKQALVFSEKVMIKEAVERQGVLKRDWEARMVPVRYVGHHNRTASVMGLTPEGVKLGSGVSRLPEQQRWTLEGWSDLKGLPWDLKPGTKDAPIARRRTCSGLGFQTGKAGGRKCAEELLRSQAVLGGARVHRRVSRLQERSARCK